MSFFTTLNYFSFLKMSIFFKKNCPSSTQFLNSFLSLFSKLVYLKNEARSWLSTSGKPQTPSDRRAYRNFLALFPERTVLGISVGEPLALRFRTAPGGVASRRRTIAAIHQNVSTHRKINHVVSALKRRNQLSKRDRANGVHRDVMRRRQRVRDRNRSDRYGVYECSHGGRTEQMVFFSFIYLYIFFYYSQVPSKTYLRPLLVTPPSTPYHVRHATPNTTPRVAPSAVGYRDVSQRRGCWRRLTTGLFTSCERSLFGGHSGRLMRRWRAKVIGENGLQLPRCSANLEGGFYDGAVCVGIARVENVLDSRQFKKHFIFFCRRFFLSFFAAHFPGSKCCADGTLCLKFVEK